MPQAEYAALLGCPAVFRCDTCSLVFAREVLDRPYSRANTEVARALRSEAEHELGVLLDAELRTRVEQVLGASGESPLPEVVARRLGMSVRTLQRRLGEEGTSFREIRDSVRLSRARRLLTEARLSISEVAERLGFADVSAFDNAFKRWTGETPNALRARLQASEGARSTGARSRSG